MSTMAENVIAAGPDNRPPMLEKSQYNSWQSRMLLYIRGKEHGKEIYDSVINGPFQFGTVEVSATPTTPAFTRERTMDDLTNKEKIREACDIRPKCSKFVTDVKLAKDMHESSFDKLDAYLRKHEVYANEFHMMRQQFSDPIALVTNTYNSFYNNPQPQYNLLQYNQQSSTIPQQQQLYTSLPQPHPYKAQVYQQSYPTPVVHQQSYQAPAVQQQSPVVFPQLDSGLAVPSFVPTDDLITSLNKAMSFTNIEFASQYPSINSQLRTSSNPRNQATIQDGSVIVHNVQG
ncbi:hypothetical protein Tco_1205598 [Tanacetum coccineum]